MIVVRDDSFDEEEKKDEVEEDGSREGYAKGILGEIDDDESEEAIFAGFVDEEASIDADFARAERLLLSSTSKFPLTDEMSKELLSVLRSGVRTGVKKAPSTVQHRPTVQSAQRPWTSCANLCVPTSGTLAR